MIWFNILESLLACFLGLTVGFLLGTGLEYLTRKRS